MNIQKSRLLEDSNNETRTFSQLNNHSSVINQKCPSQGFKHFVSERQKGSNKLLFGLTVTALTMIMGGSIFFAVNQYQLPATPSNLSISK